MKSNPLITSSLALLLAASLAWGEPVIKDGDSIAFLGDSLTQLGYQHKPNGYVNLVLEGLKSAGVNVTPYPVGIGGNTTRDMLARLDRDVISKKPAWMTLNSGINDSPRMDLEEFSANLAEIVDRATGAGIKVILITTSVGAGESLKSPETAKRATFAEAFRKLGRERGLIVADMNAVMTRELTERQKENPRGPWLTYDGTHLNGIGNQIFAAEVLRAMGLSDAQLAELRKRWADYPFAAAQPEVSVNDYLKLKALADRHGKTVEEEISEILTGSVK